ncbi:MAG: putative vancomycin resistance protein [Frankiales bacterium]|nr:putative vancomycin resistance protein [Frankiales bacterium]
MRGKVVAGVLAALLGTGALGAGALVVLGSAEALPGTTVAGRDVSGLDEATLRSAVEGLAAARTRGALPVTAEDVRGEVDRGVTQVDVDATVDAALRAGRDGTVDRVLGPLLGAAGGETGRPVELVITVEESALQAEVERLAEAVDRAPDPGGIEVRGTAVSGRQPRAGRLLGDVLTPVRQALQQGREEPLDLPVTAVAPLTTAADVDGVVQQARRALGGPYRLSKDGESLTVSPAEVAPLLSSPLVGDALVLEVDLPKLNELVARKAEALERPASEAGFVVAGAPPVVAGKGDLSWAPQPAQVAVTPGATGLAVDVEPATARLSELITAGDRTTERQLPLKVVEPELTTAGAQAAGVRSLIGTFTTSFQAGQPRATNIRRIAEIVNGAYIAPGETFSLNGTAGRRTLGRGFVADGAIVDGELTDEVGGGVSQFATTLFNAAFFAGLPIPEHKPHSFYISRYPPGRESTVYFGSIDVKVQNDTGHGIHVETSSTPGSVTVALYGDNGGRRVTASHGPRQPREGGGFRIAVTRRISGGDGVGGTRVFRTTYVPEPEST